LPIARTVVFLDCAAGGRIDAVAEGHTDSVPGIAPVGFVVYSVIRANIDRPFQR
jgi:hypothetical protein